MSRVTNISDFWILRRKDIQVIALVFVILIFQLCNSLTATSEKNHLFFDNYVNESGDVGKKNLELDLPDSSGLMNNQITNENLNPFGNYSSVFNLLQQDNEEGLDPLLVLPANPKTPWHDTAQYKLAVSTLCPKLKKPLSPDCVRPVIYTEVFSKASLEHKIANYANVSIIISPYAAEFQSNSIIPNNSNSYPVWMDDKLNLNSKCNYILESYLECAYNQVPYSGTCMHGTCIKKYTYEYPTGKPIPARLSNLAKLAPNQIGCKHNGCEHMSTQCMPLSCVYDITVKEYRCIWIPERNEMGKPCSNGSLCMIEGKCNKNGSCDAVNEVKCEYATEGTTGIQQACKLYQCNPRIGKCEFTQLDHDEACIDGTCTGGHCIKNSTCGNGIIDNGEICDWAARSSGIGGICCYDDCTPVPDELELPDCLNNSEYNYHRECVISWCERGKCKIGFMPTASHCNGRKGLCNGSGECVLLDNKRIGTY